MNEKIKYGLSAAVLALIGAGASAPEILDQFLDEKEGNHTTAYRDGAGIWTICRGAILVDGKPVIPGMKLSKEKCDRVAGAITLPMVGVTSLAVATGALAYAWYQGDSTLSAFNKTLVLSGNQSGLTADRMLTLSRAGQAAGLTFNQASESLAALVNAGVRGGEQFDAINQSVARFASASGVEVDKVAEAFGKLTTDPTSGLMAMARQFRNVTAEQIAYVAQLQRSGDEAGALQAANDIATKGFDEQTRRLKENMGTLETWADKTGKAFKSMWDAILDIGRPESSADMLASAQKAFDEADKKWQWYQSRSQRRGKTASFRANLQGAWNDRENARLGLAAATLQSDMEKAGELAARDRAERDASQLKYTGEAQKAYERLLTPLEKYTARQEELNKALKDGKILQADYNTLMAAAKKDYESTLKKPKSSGVKVSAGERQEDQAHAALLALETELRTLEKHSGANEKISQQRRDLWKAENQYAVLKEAATKRQLPVMKAVTGRWWLSGGRHKSEKIPQCSRTGTAGELRRLSVRNYSYVTTKTLTQRGRMCRSFQGERIYRPEE